jgi:arsenate reductase
MVTLYHNPRCSKSREALALLRDRGEEPDVRLYLEQPPNAKELKALVKKLGIKPRQLLRTKEEEYKALGLDNPALSDTALIEAMAAHPRLIERPIAVLGDKARLGRPPEQVLELLD